MTLTPGWAYLLGVVFGLLIGVPLGWHLVLLLFRPLPSPWPLLRAVCAALLLAREREAMMRRAEWEATRRRCG